MTDPTPADGAAREDAGSTRVELEVHRIAAKLGADAGRLIADDGFVDRVNALDFDGWDDFRDRVTREIRTAVAANPGLRASAPSPHEGRPAGLGAAIAGHYDRRNR